MKKRIVVCVLLSLILVLPAMADSAYDQLMATAHNYIQQMENKGWEVPDTAGHWDDIYVGQHMQFDRTLYDSNDYIFVAFGDADATDVDIAVYDDNWNKVAEDTDTSSLAVAYVSPRWTATFHIVVTLYSSHANWSDVGFVLGYQ